MSFYVVFLENITELKHIYNNTIKFNNYTLKKSY